MIGTILGHYRLLSELGRGGTATVYLAEDIHLHRQVAVKVFAPNPQTSNTTEFLAHFTREARVLARLDHPHILPVYEYGEQGTYAYLVMPYMPGGSLRDYLQKHQGPLPLEQALLFIHQILNALEYAHQQGLIHRDIKPGNILFKNEETLMLSDFGLVKIVEHTNNKPLTQDVTRTDSFAIKGTPDYMAPEQIQSRPDKTSDIYSLGIVLYEILTGQRPFHADDSMALLVKHLSEQPRPLSAFNPTITPILERVVLQALAKDPTYRFQSAAAFRTALNEAVKPDSAAPALTDMPSAIVNDSRLPASPFQRQIATTPTSPEPMGAKPTDTNYYTAPTDQSPPMPQGVVPTQKQTTFAPTILASYPPSTYSTPPPTTRTTNRVTAFTYTLIGIALTASVFALLYNTGYLNNHAASPAKPEVAINTPASARSTQTPSKTLLQPAAAAITTDCPTGSVARPATLHPVTQGSHRQLIYIVNEGPDSAPTQGTLKRRDADNTVKATPILGEPNVHINEGQVTQNGQWVVYILNKNGISQLRLLRVDGQEQQTLYCAPSGNQLAEMQLSYDGQKLVFNQYPGSGGKPLLYLYTMGTGTFQMILQSQMALAYRPMTWLDNNRVLLSSFIPDSGATHNDLYTLDITRGPNQHDSNLQKLLSQNWNCGSFDVSYDSTKLYVANCGTSDGHTPVGPTTITVQPSTGGTSQVITHLDQAVTMLRAITPTTLLLMVENGSGDTSQNGLWRMNTDGTNLTRLSRDTTGGQSLCPFSQYAWSNVSQDGQLFALQEADPHSANRKMYYGSLDTGDPTYFADISDGTDLRLVGWSRY
ncbi:hypothetical protein KSD_16940 [Ktedonobacter sp. SOSP1-85]|uniref:serine/threonine protein kinase n=1 Tax=Ktedonobacter sp. SOSP1-85 TaxID=2778367 RepID=UPI0019154F7D|nr:serine/threonine-protein kinase [Ktedonobacter sp. SOSP1-85]GHO73923.1 hypothetical protein KSD_16940 [Ktedonobacter sp. SOSP1-85]